MVISAENLRVVLGRRFVLDRITLKVMRGDVHCIEGANGSGKTTLLRTLLGANLIHSGVVRFGMGVSLVDAGWAGQKPNLLPSFSGMEMVLGPRDLAKRDSPFATSDSVKELFEGFECEDTGGKLIREMNQGDRRVTELVRAIHYGRRLILLDEPTENLHARKVGRLRKILQGLSRNGVAIVVTSHNRLFMEDLGGFRWRLLDGRLERK